MKSTKLQPIFSNNKQTAVPNVNEEDNKKGIAEDSFFTFKNKNRKSSRIGKKHHSQK